MNNRRISKFIYLTAVLLVGLLKFIEAGAECDSANVMNEMFTELKRIGEAGEAQTAIQLDQLAQQAAWDRDKANQLLLEIADSQRTREAEEFRDSLITQMFMMQSKPNLDCEQFAVLRDEVVAREQAQWEYLLGEIKRRRAL